MTGSTDAAREFDRLYAEALAAYLQHHGEEALTVAYELGRKAMHRGRGILEMTAIHRDAVASLPAGPRDEHVARREATEDFFRELLSPFEMMFRGYADANLELRRVNDTLLRERETVLAANRDLDSFSASVSHDLRAPLRAITSFSACLVETGTSFTDEQQGWLTRIRANATLMTQLIGDLLVLSRIARNEVERTRVDLTALGREVLERLKAADPSRDVEVLIQDALVVDADPGLLRVVVENLLGNAWKFTSRRPKAQIELGVASREGTQTVYFIRDDGAGFDMAHSANLFNPFQRLHSTAEFEGTGIGLATVHRIIRRHQGKIWAESEPEHGATFFFTLDQQHAA